ncbi:MAG: hypothetical protein JSU70_00565 [Phycisphaerales bacterium]|nr:MAG: hypothetical protein JSU70_00565 [Phycisphaerales bacterium]
MVMKWVKRGSIVAVGLCLAGSLLFGSDVVSYVRSSAKSVRTVVKDSVPIEFELRRARDLLEDIIPEMHANVRLIAEEEVEVAALKADIAESEKSMEDERTRIATLRAALDKPEAQYCFGGREYPRSYVKDDLARRFDCFKESEVVLASKRRLLSSREQSLHAAMELLERTRSRKRTLEDKVEALASQHRLVKAAAVGSHIQVDSSKLAQTEKLIAQIKKRLDVAERVLAHESHFVQSIPVDTIVEKDLLTQVDEYFGAKEQGTAYAKAELQEQQAQELCED